MSEKKKLTPNEASVIMIQELEKQLAELHKQQLKQAPMCDCCGSQLRNEDGSCICSRFKEVEKE